MPYLICPRCRLTTYSAALWSSIDVCPRCGEHLPPRPGATVTSIASHPRFVSPDVGEAGDHPPIDEDDTSIEPPASA
jgi:acetyl-CoA carboxylase beta subunit